MHPVLFHLGQLTIYSYGVLVATGVILGVWLASRDAPRVGLSPVAIWNFGIYGILFALVTSKIWLIMSEWSFYSASPREVFSPATLQSGGTFYGGLLGGLLWTLLYTRYEKMPLLSTLDVCAAPLALGHAIGRIGCFAAGCCFGKPTSLPWGVTFTSDIASRISGTPLNTPLHPTQLYEAAAEFLNFLFLFFVGRRWRFPGQSVGAYLALYGVERGLLEFLRDDPGRTLLFHGAVSLMQIVSLGMLAAGLFLWSRGVRDAKTAPAS
ncbi:MAG TPA: prolipoprotein diacylglyceryl transferase [Candidatus Acidoferrum sp.]|jgi:phosphatidylglycerol:prolipoprotein diacylglycerol transferase|nr:prolipoprotein diacylglyceryl transferase [Candidatus Acidoferrum sp.]